MKKYLFIVVLYAFLAGAEVFAGEADVTEVRISKNGDNTYSFSVTVSLPDTGWDHYADKWDVIDEQGNVLGVRVLHHPHVEEQPFTRGLSGVKIPTNLNSVSVRAHDSVHGYGGEVITVELN